MECLYQVDEYLHDKCSQEFSTGQLGDMRHQLQLSLDGLDQVHIW